MAQNELIKEEVNKDLHIDMMCVLCRQFVVGPWEKGSAANECSVYNNRKTIVRAIWFRNH